MGGHLSPARVPCRLYGTHENYLKDKDGDKYFSEVVMNMTVRMAAVVSAITFLIPNVLLAQDNINTSFSTIKGNEFLRVAAEAARKKVADMTFEEFKASEFVFKEPFDGGKYIVNGDTPISSEAKLFQFYNELAGTQIPGAELTVYHVDGKDIIWDSIKQSNLTYCVSNTFGANKAAVVAAMNSAAAAWEAAVEIDFKYVSSQDGNCTTSNNSVLYDVRPVSYGAYLARAFFPDDDRAQRNVLIDDSSFNVSGNLTLEGILRHELGHTIGLRHEHTRPESGTCYEDADWRGVTDYDAFSVMHYPQCNGQGDWSLNLTEMDKHGTACLYGAAPGFTIDPTICTTSVTVTDDLIWQHRGGQVHYWPMKNGQRQGGKNIYVPVSGDWHLAGVGDVDGDGTQDLVWQHRLGQVHYWTMKDGKRKSGHNVHTPVGADWTLTGAGDVDGDGTADIVWQNNRSGQVHYWPMKNGARQGGKNIHKAVGADWTLVDIGDVKGNGTDDLIWRHRNGQAHYWSMKNGSRISGHNIHTPVSGDWALECVGDVNGDNTDDLVWRHRLGQTHYWPMNNGKRQGGINIHSPVSGDWRLAGVGDVD